MPSVGSNTQKLSPRVANAIRLLKTGAVRTQKEAAEVVGLTPQYMPGVLQSPAGLAFAEKLDKQLNDASIGVSDAIRLLGHQAVKTIHSLMTHAEQPAVRLRAAVELLDRNPETAKTQKHQIEQFTIVGKDAKAIADALVESAKLREVFPEAANGDYVRIAAATPLEVIDK